MLGLSAATVSHHLLQLRLASLVESIKDGRWRLHKVSRETLDAYVEELARLVSLGISTAYESSLLLN